MLQTTLQSNLWIVGQVIGYVERCVRDEATGAPLDWYVLRSIPNAEFRARDELQKRGFVPYVPTKIRWMPKPRGKAIKVSRAVFPGYVFLGSGGPPDWLELKRVRSIAGAACIGLAPIRIRPRDMLDVMTYEAIGGFDLTIDGLRDHANRVIEKGSVVTMLKGPFEGLKGYVVRVPKAHDKPVEIECELMGRIVTVHETVDSLAISA